MPFVRGNVNDDPQSHDETTLGLEIWSPRTWSVKLTPLAWSMI
jgi:hypothetical protein